MRTGIVQRSRRALLKQGSLGVAGVLGGVGAATLVNSSVISHVHADGVVTDPIVGVWDITGNVQAVLGISLPNIPVQINGRVAFHEDGTLIGDSDVDLLPPLGGPPVLGYWIKESDGSYTFNGKRPALSGTLGKVAGTIGVQGTFTVNGNTLTGSSTLNVPLVPVALTYTITAARFGPSPQP